MLQDRGQKAEGRKQKAWLFCFVFFVPVILIAGGCDTQIRKPRLACPGKATAAESLSSLRVQLENAAALKADGQCLLQYRDGNGKQKKENFPVKLWVNPPVEIYMQGDLAFDPKGVILGANEEEFWLAVRLKEVSSYWGGRWSDGDYPEKIMISPRLVLEALGAAAAGDEEGWLLSKEGVFDVLTKREGEIKTKKIYINTCDYLVRKIEYFGGDGQAAIVMELDKYRKISKNFFVPGVVSIVNRAGGKKRDSVQITLGSVKPMEFTDKQRKRLFVRPQAQGFKHIYKIADGKVIEQPK